LPSNINHVSFLAALLLLLLLLLLRTPLPL
jgi:hypothetical protein